MHIYVDMDGVVADFDQAIVDIFGEEYSDKIADEFWKKTCVEAQVFRNMPQIPEGMEMARQLIEAELPVCFLTSTGGLPHHIDIACQKLRWLEDNGLGTVPVAFAMNTAGKARYAKPGEVLIDDRQRVVAYWRHAGGHGYVFTRHRPSIERILAEIIFGT